jgi:hypothetical protein
MNDAYLTDFLIAYVECELWSGLDWDGMHSKGEDNPEPLDRNFGPDDLTEHANWSILEDCTDFVQSNWSILCELDPGQCGHDFSLTRNHHGAGFWDPGHLTRTSVARRPGFPWYGPLGDALTKAAQIYGETDYYTTEDNKLEVS